MSSQSVRIAGKSAELSKHLGRGGEGDVYAMPGQTDQAVKVYKENLRRSREGKVRAMVESRLADKTDLVAFPSAIATDNAGIFAGFTMRLVSGYRPIHELYSPKSRKIHFPKADYRFLVRTAQNVARAVATVHQASCVIGDFNHSGVLVAVDATVALIDADSFQFSLNGQSYPCVVGTEDFTPPELHGLNLGQVERTRAHDNFGLAVAIFQLLGMGKHPYAGRYSGADLSLGQAIAQHRFAYSVARRDKTRTTPPPGSVQLDDFPRPIALAFEAAFGLDPAARPDPALWVKLLDELETSLRRCPTTPTHYFPHVANSCVWCRIASQSGAEMFPRSYAAGATVGSVPAGGPFDLGKIAAAIRSAPLPRPEDILPIWKGDLGAPLPGLRQAKSKQATHRFVGGLMVLAALIAFANAPGGAIFWIGLGAFGLFRLASAKIDPAPLLKAYTEADNRVRAASLAHLQRVGFTEMFLLRNEMEGFLGQYQQLEAGLTLELERLKATREARQRHTFLDGFLLSRVKIPGIGLAKTATLASFGIESAADVDYAAVMAVPGFGESLTGKLLQWRRQQEAKFRYNPAANPSDQQAEDAARSAAAAKRTTLQNKLRSGLTALQSAPSRFAASKGQLDPAFMHALADRAKAERDCIALRIKVPPHAALNLPTLRPIQAQPPPSRVPSPQTTTSTWARQPGPAPTPPSAVSAVACPICHASMVRRMAKKGPFAGKLFWGCSRFPQCNGKRS
jgi:DNA-binding helix-hairpin-helix protein with protein kinase domain